MPQAHADKRKGLVREKGKTKVLPVERPKRSVPSLAKLVEDEDVARFFRLVKRYDLREKALKLLKQKIADA